MLRTKKKAKRTVSVTQTAFYVDYKLNVERFLGTEQEGRVSSRKNAGVKMDVCGIKVPFPIKKSVLWTSYKNWYGKNPELPFMRV